MSFAARVANLHPLIICGVWLLPIAAIASPALTPLINSWLLIWLVWMPCVYVTARNAMRPPPQKRYPVFAMIAFALAIGGQLIGRITLQMQPIDGSSLVSPTQIASGAAFGIGFFASVWATADALVKAETGRTYLANPRSVSDVFGLLMFTGIGIWFLRPVIKRTLGGD